MYLLPCCCVSCSLQRFVLQPINWDHAPIYCGMPFEILSVSATLVLCSFSALPGSFPSFLPPSLLLPLSSVSAQKLPVSVRVRLFTEDVGVSVSTSYNLVASRSISPPRLTRDLRYNEELSGPVHSPLCKKEACPITCNLSHTSMYLVPGCDVPRCGLAQGMSITTLYVEAVFSLVLCCVKCFCGCVCGILPTANSLLRFTLSLSLSHSFTHSLTHSLSH